MEDNYIDDGLMQSLENDLGEELYPHDDQDEWDSNLPEHEPEDNSEGNEHIDDSLSDWDDNDTQSYLDHNEPYDEPDVEPWDGE